MKSGSGLESGGEGGSASDEVGGENLSEETTSEQRLREEDGAVTYRSEH